MWNEAIADGEKAEKAKRDCVAQATADYFTLRLHHQIIECVLAGCPLEQVFAMSIGERSAYLSRAALSQASRGQTEEG